MRVNQIKTLPEDETGPRLQIKRVARRLIAENGVHNVSVREIALASNQRNLGVVAYYFGTKDRLISEILIDGAARIEARRNVLLDSIESEGGPKTVLEAVEAIILPSAQFADEDDVYGSFFNLYLLNLSAYSRELLDSTLEGDWNAAYQRCLTHLRGLLTHLTQSEQSRRFVFFNSYVASVLAQRDVMRADDTSDHPTWTSEETLRDIIQTAAALLTAEKPQ